MKDNFNRNVYDWDSRGPSSEKLMSIMTTKKDGDQSHELSEANLKRLSSPSQSPTLQERVGLQHVPCSPEHPIETVLLGLSSPQWPLRVEAIRALEQLGKQASTNVADALSNALQDDSNFVRAAAARALGVIGALHAKNALMFSYADYDWNVRAAAIEALGTLEEYAPVETLQHALDDKDSTVQIVAIWTLVKLKERAPINALIKKLQDSNETIRAATVGALGLLAERVPVEVFVKMLQDEDEIVRAAAVEVLGTFGERAPIHVLLQALQDEDEIVRIAVVSALGRLGEHTPIESLVCMLQDQDEGVRVATVKALGAMNERAPVEALIFASKDPSQEVQSAVNSILGEKLNVSALIDGASLDFLLHALQDENYVVRAIAIWALGQLNDWIPLEPLKLALKDTHQAVRSMARRVLDQPNENTPIQSQAMTRHDPHHIVHATAKEMVFNMGDRASKTSFHHSLLNFFKENRGYVEQIHREKADKHILVLYCFHSSSYDPLQQKLKVLGGLAPVASLHDALESSDECIREVAMHIWGLPRAQLWKEAFILSLGLIENWKRELGLISAQDCPEQIVLCSVGSSQTFPEKEDQPSLYDQLLAAWPLQWRAQVCTHEEELLNMKLWHGIRSNSTQLELYRNHC